MNENFQNNQNLIPDHSEPMIRVERITLKSHVSILPGVLFIFAIAALAGFLIFARANTSWPFGSALLPIENNIENKDNVACIQVVTPARNKTTGEVKDFSTPCDVPPGWEKLDDESAIDWKTYRNEEYGFEIAHPSDWTSLYISLAPLIVRLIDPDIADQYRRLESGENFHPSDPSMVISVHKDYSVLDESKLAPQNLADFIKKYSRSEYPKLTDVKASSLGDKTAYIANWHFSESFGPTPYLYAENGSNIYIVFINEYSPAYNVNLINRILSTFKFIK